MKRRRSELKNFTMLMRFTEMMRIDISIYDIRGIFMSAEFMKQILRNYKKRER